MITTKTLDELQAIGLGSIRADLPTADTSPGSDYDISTRMVAAVGMLNQRQAEDLAKQILPADAEDEFVQQHMKDRGLTAQAAAASLGKVQLVASAGTATQPTASVLTHPDGTVFTTSEPGAIALPAWTGKTCAADCGLARVIVSPDTTGINPEDILSINGAQRAIREIITAISAVDLYEPLPAIPTPGAAISAVRGKVVDIVASVVGKSGKKPVGDLLTVAAPATNVQATARIIELGGGGDAETIEEQRSRCVDHDAGHPGGGNVEHVRLLARETPGVRLADAIVFPGFRGLGTIDVVCIGVDGARVTGTTALAAVYARLRAELAYDADIVVSPISLTVTEYDVDVTVTPEVGFERDFISAGAAINAAPASTTSRIELTSDLRAVAEQGDRILVTQRVGPFWKTTQVKLTAIYATAVEVDLPLPVIPVSTDPSILPGGPLAESLIATIEQLFESLGPSRRNLSPAFTFERHPLPSIAWDDTLLRARIDTELMGVTGAHNVAITTPAADVQPGAKENVRRGKILIRFLDP